MLFKLVCALSFLIFIVSYEIAFAQNQTNQTNDIFQQLAGTYKFYKSEYKLNNECDLTLVIDDLGGYKFNLEKINICGEGIFFDSKRKIKILTGQIVLTNDSLNNEDTSLRFDHFYSTYNYAAYANDLILFYDFLFLCTYILIKH